MFWTHRHSNMEYLEECMADKHQTHCAMCDTHIGRQSLLYAWIDILKECGMHKHILIYTWIAQNNMNTWEKKKNVS